VGSTSCEVVNGVLVLQIFIVIYPLGTTILHPNDGLRSLSIDEADTTQEEIRFQPSYTNYVEAHNVLQSLGERE